MVAKKGNGGASRNSTDLRAHGGARNWTTGVW